jgi:hypothetical protein
MKQRRFTQNNNMLKLMMDWVTGVHAFSVPTRISRADKQSGFPIKTPK